MKKHSIKQLLGLYAVAVACANGFSNEYSRDAANQLLADIEAEIDSRIADIEAEIDSRIAVKASKTKKTADAATAANTSTETGTDASTTAGEQA